MVMATAMVSEITKKIWLIEEVSTSAKVALIRNRVIKLMDFNIQIPEDPYDTDRIRENWFKLVWIKLDEVIPCKAEYEPAFSAETVDKRSSNAAECKLHTTNCNWN